MPDEEIDEIRAIRHQMSAECGHDVRRLAEYIRRVEEELRRSGKYRFGSKPATSEAALTSDQIVESTTN